MTGDLERARTLLASQDEPTRLRGVHLLRDSAESRGEAARLLVETLLDRGSYVSHAARGALQSMGVSALECLMESLPADDPRVRAQCAWALAVPWREHADRVAGSVAALVADPDPTVRLAVAAALGRIGATSDLLAEPLRRLASDTDRRVRAEAVRSLGTDPILAERSRQQFLDALDDGVAQVRSAAAAALAGLPPDRVSSARIREALDEEIDEGARGALAALLERWESRP